MTAPAAPPERLGRYRLVEKLGEGGMGVVFAGVHEGLGREVAIKLLRGQYAGNPQLVSRFQREAEAVSRIGHANIVAVYDFGQLDDGGLYYVMERVRGETLGGRLHRAPPVERDEAVAIFAQLCRALQAAHKLDIVHRDLKPENVLLRPQDHGFAVAKILDFGIAKMLEEQSPDGGARLTRTGMVMGTPAYMSPEQINSCHTVDGRADLYSLGAILYELVAGTPPYGVQGEPMAMMARVLLEAVPPPSQVATRPVPPALDAMILRALSKKPEARQPDAAAFLAELEAAWPAHGAPRATPTAVGGVAAASGVAAMSGMAPLLTAPPPVTTARRPRAALVAAALAGAALAAGGYAWVHRRPSAPPVTAVTRATDPLRARAGKMLDQALSGNAAERRAALEAIAEAADRSSLDAIMRGLADDNPEVRRTAAAAAAAAGEPGDAALRTALAAAAQRSGGSVALDLAVARGRLGDPSVRGELERALHAPDGTARLRAAVALADDGALGAPALRAALAAAPPTAGRSTRWRAFVRLCELGDRQLLGELKTGLRSTDRVTKLDAAQTLARTGDPAGRAALVELAADPADGLDALVVLAALGDPGAYDGLRRSLHDPRAATRARAAAALARLAPSLSDRSAVPHDIGPLLDDADLSARLAAAVALRGEGQSAP